MQVEQLLVHLHHLLAVAGVHPHLVVADPAGKPQPRHRDTGRPHVDRQVAAQVQAGLALLVPGVGKQRLAVPLLEHETDVDVLLKAAYPELLAAGGHQHADRWQRAAGGVRLDLRVVDAEHPAVREDGHDQL